MQLSRNIIQLQQCIYNLGFKSLHFFKKMVKNILIYCTGSTTHSSLVKLSVSLWTQRRFSHEEISSEIKLKGNVGHFSSNHKKMSLFCIYKNAASLFLWQGHEFWFLVLMSHYSHLLGNIFKSCISLISWSVQSNSTKWNKKAEYRWHAIIWQTFSDI